MNSNLEQDKIEILPEHVIDQIKAGEVLERPASLVKELIENSIDAEATNINLHIVENGMELLSISDNGKGMDFTNLPFAFLRHATSKLKAFEDIYRLHSFGFRGEALASISSSSRLTCTSQPKDINVEGGKIVINGGATELLVPYKTPSFGTSIFIKDLFYNTPARLKFIKSKNSEKLALKKMIYSFILSNPQISFSIKWDDKEKEIFKSTSDNLSRISQVFFGKENLKDHLFSIKNDHDNYNIEVFFTKETYTSPQYRHHYLFVNGRFFHDKSFHQSILRTLDSIWPNGTSGHYVIKISAPSDEIDVNVHPNKTQIKFLKNDIVYSLLVTSLKEILRKDIFPKQPNHSLDHIQSTLIDGQLSKTEIRDFDIQNFKSTASADPLTGLPHVSYFSNTEYDINSIIENRFVFFNMQDTFYLCDLFPLLISHYSTILEKNNLDDIPPTPLLISEPFKYDSKIDYAFEHLKKLGFEFDRLSKEVIVLRTLPIWIKESDSRGLIHCLLGYFLANRINIFNSKDFLSYASNHFKLESFPHDFFDDTIKTNKDHINRVATKLNAEICLRILK